MQAESGITRKGQRKQSDISKISHTNVLDDTSF